MKNNRTFLEKLLDGVEVQYEKLSDVLPIKRGKRVVRNELDENGIYPVYQNSLQPLGYFNNKNCEAYTTFIIAAGAAGEIGFSEVEFWAADDCYYFECPKEVLNNKFLYYVLMAQKHNLLKKVRKASIPRLGKDTIEKLSIPIPPLSVQTEIVQILDTLTALTSELTSELILRRKQYEYYREKLLSFDSLERLNEGGGKKKLIDVVKIKNGKDWKHLGEGDIPIYGSGGIMGYVDTYSYDKPTVLIPRKGSITNIFYLEEPFWNVDTIYYTEIDTTQILPKYFYHFMKTVDLTKLDTGSGRPSLTQAILNEIPIFVPSIEEQHRIVSILDKFETLTNSITEGLPLAIEQSQNRYEYYRELLLNFS
jgi:type I restriction enzyme specificity protein hsdS